MDASFDRQIINNAYYDNLAEKWYTAFDDPVALLRAETIEKIKWAEPLLKQKNVKNILDVGCGGGFATNALGQMNYTVTGLDFSQSTLDIAQKMNSSKSVRYVQGDAYQLPFSSGSFDAVLAFDFLEHVSDPKKIIAEIARVLKPGGQFLFHTFNRNSIAWLIVIKGVEWFVKNTPKDLHTLSLFIKPSELEDFCRQSQLRVEQWTGLRPRFNLALLRMLKSREVPKNFEFCQTSSRLISYCGQAVKH